MGVGSAWGRSTCPLLQLKPERRGVCSPNQCQFLGAATRSNCRWTTKACPPAYRNRYDLYGLRRSFPPLCFCGLDGQLRRDSFSRPGFGVKVPVSGHGGHRRDVQLVAMALHDKPSSSRSRTTASRAKMRFGRPTCFPAACAARMPLKVRSRSNSLSNSATQLRMG